MTYTSIACSQCGAPLPLISSSVPLVCEYCCTSHVSTLPNPSVEEVEPPPPPRTADDIRNDLLALEHEWQYLLRRHSVFFGEAPCAERILNVLVWSWSITVVLLICTGLFPWPFPEAIRNMAMFFELILCGYWTKFCSNMMEVAQKLKTHENRINMRRRHLEIELAELE